MKQFFVVGTACTELEALYSELILLCDRFGVCQKLNERHMSVVANCTVRGTATEADVLKTYSQYVEQSFVDKSHPNLWLTEALIKKFPHAKFVCMRAPDGQVDRVVRQMLKSSSCKRWCQNFQKLPFPSNFLGTKTMKEYQVLSEQSKLKSRTVSHFLEMDRLAEKYPDRFIVLTPFQPAVWKAHVAKLCGIVKSAPPISSTPPPQPKPAKPKPAKTPPPKPAKSPPPKPAKTPPPKPASGGPAPQPPSIVDANRAMKIPEMQATPKSTSLDKKIAFYWINLDCATERKKQMENQLNARNLTHHRIPAIDGRTKGAIDEFIPRNWNQSAVQKHKLELATTLSHLKAIQRFAQSGEPIGIICEDDTLFEFEDKWPCSLQYLIDNAPKGWEILQLSITLPNPREWQNLRAKKSRYVRRQALYFSALTYAISRPYALSLLKKYSIPVDSNKFTAQLKGNVTRLQSEVNLLGTGLKRFTIYPAFFTYPTGNTSFIHPGHLRGHEQGKQLHSQHF